MNPFWMVVRLLGPSDCFNNAPTREHVTEQSARAEAERLARNNPGQRFAVLRSVAVACKHDVAWEEIVSEMPF